MVDQHNREMNDIADILFAMEQNFQERENDAKSEFQSMRDEIKNKVNLLIKPVLCTKFCNVFVFKSIIMLYYL